MNNPLIFSTLACPEWSINKTIACAAEFGYDGIEWRGGPAGHINPLSASADRLALRSCSMDAGLMVHSVTAYTSFTSEKLKEHQANIDELQRYADLAAEISAPYVRAFLGELPPGTHSNSIIIGRMIASLKMAAAYARTVGVRIVIEPHDHFVRSADVAPILTHPGEPRLGVIWDVGNTYAAGEDYRQGFALLADFISYVHLKDGRGRGDTWQLCQFGEGDIPLKEIVGLLAQADFGGALCVEWERAWHPELEPPDVALPHAARVIRSLLAEFKSDSPQPQP